MGQQQIMLIVLSVILVGFAVTVGIQMFRDNAINANRDAIYNDLANVAAKAYQYKLSSASIGGGAGSYVGVDAANNTWLGSLSTENADYAVTVNGANSVTIIGTGNYGATPWIIQCDIDASGNTTYTVNQTGSLN